MKLPDSYIESMAARIARRPLIQCDELQLLNVLKALSIHEDRHTGEPLEA